MRNIEQNEQRLIGTVYEGAPAERLGHFIHNGLELIEVRNYQGAIAHFRNREVAESIGFDLVIETYRVDGLTFGEYCNVLHSISQYSSIVVSEEDPKRPMMVIRDIDHVSDLGGYGPESGFITPQDVYCHIALNYVNIWTLANRYLTGEQQLGDKDR